MYLRNMAAALIIAPLFCLTSCMLDFEIINSDPDRPFTHELEKDNKWAAYVKSMQLTLFPEDDNAYQRMDELHGNIYSGYHGEAQWWNGQNSTTYVFNVSPGWHNVGFQVVYGSVKDPKYPVPGIMNTWNQLRQKADSTSVVFAAGEIIKVAGMHRATDMYGPIPYTQYGKKLYPEYDSQETIYKTFFKELDHAIGILTDYHIASPAAKPIADYDIMFGSDMQKWIKFANSLKLRLAMRIKYVEPALAQQYAVEAVTHQFGVIEDNAGNAYVGETSLYRYVNPITMLWQGYSETKMGAPMDSYMNGYQDPRLAKYFSPVASGTYQGQYKGGRYGYSNAPSGYALCSTPLFTEGDAIPFMTAAEVYFLRAEGAIEGWAMNGTAEDLYNKGIEMSMGQWGVSGSAVSPYVNNNVLTPVVYVDPARANEAAPSTITIKWNNGASKDQKLERIITQKWIAMYPNGQEAWSEYRRTGYPKVFGPVTNQNLAQVPDNIIRRIPLPAIEKQNNSTVYNKAIQDHFEGAESNDNPGYKLWWDAR